MFQLAIIILLLLIIILSLKLRSTKQENSKLKKEVKELRVDPVTGLYRRSARSESEILQRMYEARRNGWAKVVMVLDLDGLKITNDTFGHKAGDLILKRVAAIMKSCLRPYDLLYRWGGDEFVIVITFDAKGQDPIKASKILKDRICKRAKAEPSGYPISVSCGIALIEDWDFANAFKRADEDMYAEKMTRKRN